MLMLGSLMLYYFFDIGKTSSPIQQVHFGDGDNVGGNKK